MRVSDLQKSQKMKIWFQLHLMNYLILYSTLKLIK
jgi:hypothetical protein